MKILNDRCICNGFFKLERLLFCAIISSLTKKYIKRYQTMTTRYAHAKESVNSSSLDIEAQLAALEDHSELVERSPAELLSLNSKGMTTAYFTRADSKVQSFIDGIASICKSLFSVFTAVN